MELDKLFLTKNKIDKEFQNIFFRDGNDEFMILLNLSSDPNFFFKKNS